MGPKYETDNEKQHSAGDKHGQSRPAVKAWSLLASPATLPQRPLRNPDNYRQQWTRNHAQAPLARTLAQQLVETVA